MLTWMAKAIATAFGPGYSPIAPGTCGTAAAVPLAWLLRDLSLPLFALICAAVTAIGIVAAELADRAWGTHDNGRIVIDEVAGLLVTVALVDRSSFWVLLAGFGVFRFFDVVKPPPVRAIDDKLGGGVGVVLDDVAAGFMGCAVMVALDALGFFSWLAQLS